MKIYVLYVMSDYAHAIFISTDKQLCEQEMKQCKKRGVKYPMYIKEYDFSNTKSFDLDCD